MRHPPQAAGRKGVKNMIEELMQEDKEYIANTYGRFPMGIIKGNGASCWDMEGKECLDFTSGIGVNSLGFCHPAWVAAVQRQAEILNHTSNLYYQYPCIQLAKKLSKKTGCKKVFFGNSGAEANEGALKAARKYSAMKYGEGRYEIITLQNSFHGRTLQTLTATGQDGFHQHFGPFCEGYVYAPAGDMEALRQVTNEKTCAVMIEIIQGEGGVIALSKEYVQALRAFCDEKDLVLIVDEVQTGVGRTGTFLACQQMGIVPDVVALAKGLGGGLPIGAVLLYEKVEDALQAGDHGSTFGGNPIVCAGANAVMDQMTDELMASVLEKGELIRSRLSHMPHVKSVDGMGLMLGVAFDQDILGKDVVGACLEKKVMFLTAKEKLRMLPSLTITEGEIQKGMNVLESVLTNWAKEA